MAETKQTTGTAETQEQSVRDPEEIEREIEVTREELGDTVAELAAKADVKAQAKRKVDETKTRAHENPIPFAVAGAIVGGLVLAWLLRR